MEVQGFGFGVPIRFRVECLGIRSGFGPQGSGCRAYLPRLAGFRAQGLWCSGMDLILASLLGFWQLPNSHAGTNLAYVLLDLFWVPGPQK